MTAPLRPPRPKTIEFAFMGCVVSALSAFVTVILYFVGRDDMIALGIKPLLPASMLSQEQKEEMASSVVDSSLTTVAAFYLSVACLTVALAILVRRRRNWARIVLTVVAVVGLAGVRTSINGQAISPAGMLPLLTLAVNIAVIVLLYVPASNRYFAKPKPQG
ncbi:hypothetical protein GCM10022247_22620 [Allokutzneria multivorans]|uniref:DUF2127 domain-containing protein n=1 Tax=Allokutzneria multivorans TaxID=1142134 RepID=A0ABP7RS17_9PSEU